MTLVQDRLDELQEGLLVLNQCAAILYTHISLQLFTPDCRFHSNEVS